MSTTDLVIGLIGGGTLGSVGTAIYTASHQRAERFRDRMIDAADTYLEAEADAAKKLLRLSLTSDDFLKTRNASIEGAGQASKDVDEFNDAHPDDDEGEPPEVFARALRAMDLANSVDALSNPFDEAARAQAASVAALVSEAGLELQLYEDSSELEPLRLVVARVLALQSGFITAMEAQFAAAAEWSAAVEHLHHVTPRLAVLFAEDGEARPVYDSAIEAREALQRSSAAIAKAGQELRPALGDEAVTTAVQEANDAVEKFAVAVNRHVRKRRL